MKVGYFDRIAWDIIVNTLGRSLLIPHSIRYRLYRFAGMKTKTSNIRSGCTFRGKNVEIEKGAFLNSGVFIDSYEKVVIKENASLAFGTMICTSSHEISSSERRAGESIRQPVTVGRGCWLGARTTVLPGVEIGDGTIVAAGSVVTKNCEPNSLYAGVPARLIKKLD